MMLRVLLEHPLLCYASERPACKSGIMCLARRAVRGVTMSKLRLKPQYLTDETGRKKLVVLSVAEYEKLLCEHEDRADAAILDRAIDRGGAFKSLEDVKKALRKKGRL